VKAENVLHRDPSTLGENLQNLPKGKGKKNQKYIGPGMLIESRDMEFKHVKPESVSCKSPDEVTPGEGRRKDYLQG